ncbi:MAG: DUF3536 domain-containing protein [Sphaerochaeta sp.]
MKTPTTALILHGHFYQPPRENPYTGLIDIQRSAAPFSDWNERITADCYRANTHSRYLNGYGQILSMSNNYSSLSFNFGPTLLSWIHENHPATYEAIIEADRESLGRLGHGNAIAQAYSHPILPLQKEHDVKTQVLWALEDFSARFGRPSEGLWLSETAINPTVIDVLAQCGIKFVILSPWQAKETEKEGLLKGRPAPYYKPFILTGPKGGTVSAFFYNHVLAEGISFGHYLRDADALYAQLLDIKKKDTPQLIHTATDGEIYGHHEPYGDMALAALVKKCAAGGELEFTNYGAYLAANPATEWAILHDGEEKKGTSWSCTHGVSRWYKDCGCYTGGNEKWNQKWRTPLRRAFDTLANRIDDIYLTEATKIVGSEEAAIDLLNRFAPVASHVISLEEYLRPITREASTITELGCLLQGQKYKHYSYTSCGWFFNDLAGLEPKQNITYALMAAKLYEKYDSTLTTTLLGELEKAKANEVEDGNGKTIALEQQRLLSGEGEAALYFILNRTLALPSEQEEHYGFYRLEYFAHEGESARLTITNTQCLKVHTIEATIGQGEYEVTIGGVTTTFTATDIPNRMRTKLLKQIDRRICTVDEDQIIRLDQSLIHYSLLAQSAPSVLDPVYQQLVGWAISMIKGLFIFERIRFWEHYKERFLRVLDFFVKYGKEEDMTLLREVFDQAMVDIAEKILRSGLFEQSIRFVSEFLVEVRKRTFQPDLTALQDALYPYITGEQLLENEEDITLVHSLAQDLNFDSSITARLTAIGRG